MKTQVGNNQQLCEEDWIVYQQKHYDGIMTKKLIRRYQYTTERRANNIYNTLHRWQFSAFT